MRECEREGRRGGGGREEGEREGGGRLLMSVRCAEVAVFVL